MDRGVWQATVHGVANSQTQLSTQARHYLFKNRQCLVIFIYVCNSLLAHHFTGFHTDSDSRVCMGVSPTPPAGRALRISWQSSSSAQLWPSLCGSGRSHRLRPQGHTATPSTHASDTSLRSRFSPALLSNSCDSGLPRSRLGLVDMPGLLAELRAAFDSLHPWLWWQDKARE